VAKEMLVILLCMLTRHQLYNGVKEEGYKEKLALLRRMVQEATSQYKEESCHIGSVETI
jgi:hypothetical protein